MTNTDVNNFMITIVKAVGESGLPPIVAKLALENIAGQIDKTLPTVYQKETEILKSRERG